MEDNKSRRDEMDSFWDIDSLLPAKKEDKKPRNISFDTSTVSVESSEKAVDSNDTVKSSPLSIERNGTTITRFIPHTAREDADLKEPFVIDLTTNLISIKQGISKR